MSISIFGSTVDDISKLWQAHEAAAWQCPGCGTIYTFMINSCACQRRNMASSGNTTNPNADEVGV